jgi:hypothetical protein
MIGIRSLIFLGFILANNFLSAQNIQIYDKKDQLVNNDTFVFNVAIDTLAFFAGDFEKKDFAFIVNNSSSSMTIRLERIEISPIPNTFDYLCWGNTCFNKVKAFSQPVWDVNDEINVAPGDTAGGFGLVVYLDHQKQTGQALYKYRFYNKNNPLDTATIYVKYLVDFKDIGIELYRDEEIINGDTILRSLTIDTTSSTVLTMEDSIVSRIVNYSASSRTIGLRRIYLGNDSTLTDGFCWKDSCLSGIESSLSDSIIHPQIINTPVNSIVPGSRFAFSYTPRQPGNHLFEYRFFDINDPSFHASLYVNFNVKALPPFSSNNLLLLTSDNQMLSDDTLVFNHDVDTLLNLDLFEYQSRLKLVNNSPNFMKVVLRREVTQALPEVEDYLCWGSMCYLPVKTDSVTFWNIPDTLQIAPGDTIDQSLWLFLKPQDQVGELTFRYRIINLNDPDISSFFYLNYNLNYKEEGFELWDRVDNSLKDDTLLYKVAVDSTDQDYIFTSPTVIRVLNYASDTVKIGVKRKVVSGISGVEDEFCWLTNCSGYNPITKLSEKIEGGQLINPLTIVDGDNSLQIHIKPNINYGKVTYQYTFYDLSDTAKSSSLYFQFDLQRITSLPKIKAAADFKLFPNPATEAVTIQTAPQYKGESYLLEVRNLLGELVHRQSINGQSTLEVSDFTPGIYFLGVYEGQRAIAIRKLIVR